MKKRQYKKYYDRLCCSEDIPRTTKFRKKQDQQKNTMETENLPSISTNTEKSRIPEQPLQVFSLPAHSCQSSSSDTTEAEFQHHLNLSNDDVSKKNQKNREETEKETDESWNDAQSSEDSSLSDFLNETSTALSETPYESDGERMALNPTFNENYNVEDNGSHHGDFGNAHQTNFDEDSDDDQSVIDTEDFERKGCPDENGPYDPYLNEGLSIGITITRGEVLLMCLTLATRHSFTWVAIIDLLKLINKLFNRRDVVPETKYKLLQHVPMEMDSTKYHFYCRNCKTYLGERTKVKTGNSINCTCGSVVDESDSSFFLSLGFKSQIKRLLQNREVQRSLEYRFQRIKVNNNSFEDIYDGNMYKKLSEFDGPLSIKWNLSYTLNTDGCQAANSSKVTTWPIYAIINELPPKIRAKHTLLIGLWADKNEPDMKLFLPPFIKEANELSTDGLQWQLNEDTVITSLIIPSACCVDSIARADMLNMKRMNAVHGCTFCEHKTETVDGYRRFTMSTTIFPERTDESMKENMIRAFDEDTDICGIKGPSALMNLTFFDLVDGMVPDYMHSVLLGVIRQHTELLMSSPEEAYYAGAPNKKSIINRRLSSITPPKCITRSPRSIDERRMWKASEWRSWLIWYVILCLRGLIPIKYIQHLALLVSAINILLQSSITPVQLQTARTLLIKYVVDFQKYYGKKSMTYNVHLLLHLTKSVENWGPLWAINCFSFENENRLLLLMKKSPTRIMLQISQRFLFIRSLINFSDKLLISNNVTQFCQKLYENKVKFFSTVQNCVLIGSGKQYNLNEEETESLGYRVFNCKTYQKIIYNGKRYTSESYKRCTRTNDSVVETATGMVGIISNICRIKNDCNEERVILFIRDVQVDGAPYISTNHVKVSHIRRCYPGIGVLHTCTPASIIDQCIFINVDNRYYVSNIPRGCLGD